MAQIDPLLVYRRAHAGAGPDLYVAASFLADMREQDAYHPRTRLLHYNHTDRIWLGHDLPQHVTALCAATLPGHQSEVLVSLSAEGEVFFKDSAAGHVEQIADAGVFNDQPQHRGRMWGLTEIHGQLYACGEGGQIYRRDAPNQWRWLDPGLALMDATPFFEAGRQVGNDIRALLAIDTSPVMDDRARKSFHNLGGSSEQAIYVTGYDGSVLFWDGRQSHWIEGLPKKHLFAVLPEDDRNVWICGRDGTLLLGNHRDGFKNYWPGRNLSFNAMAKFDGTLYLTANGGYGGPVGLYAFDGTTLDRVDTGLHPEIDDVSMVTAGGGLLWVLGAGDIICFDGQRWERIDHPDNPPVR